METRSRMIAAGIGTAGLFLAVQIGALALVQPFVEAGYQAVEDPTDPINSLVYLGAILVATAFILGVVWLGADRAIRAVVIAMSAVLAYYVFSVVVPPGIVLGGLNGVAVGAGGVIAVALYVYPEWYVIDSAGVLIAAGGAGIFGISFGPLPAILLLGVLAVYDAISVYRTEHMLTLAESVTELKLPLLLVIPLSLSYSFLDATPTAEEGDDAADSDPNPRPADRDAFFVGLGDTVIPTVMVASAALYATAPGVNAAGISMNLPALGAMIGTFVGLTVLLVLVARGRPHAGLPLLNGGAIGGYLVASVVVGIPVVEAAGITPYL